MNIALIMSVLMLIVPIFGQEISDTINDTAIVNISEPTLGTSQINEATVTFTSDSSLTSQQVDITSQVDLLQTNDQSILALVETNTLVTNTSTNQNTTVTNVATNEEVELVIDVGDFTPRNVFAALVKSYPNIVTTVPASQNPYYPDLAIKVRDTIFYNVNGRFLPEEERTNWKMYGSNTYYSYAQEIPDPKKRTPEEIKLMKKQGSKAYRKAKKPSYFGFNEKLYGLSNLADTNEHIVKTRFLGKQVLIHQMSYEALKTVEKEIYDLTNDFEHGYLVRRFLKEGQIVYSFFWRTIAGTKSRSLHSYGVAIDVLEKDSKKAMYWLWRQNQKINWITEPICVRWNPPDVVVKIFEKYGFVWGGKWNFYDTMHFEYKPEILMLNGYDVKLLNQSVPKPETTQTTTTNTVTS